MRRGISAAVVAALLLLVTILWRQPDTAAPVSRTIVDMVGRIVTLPATVRSVATLGAVPVLNGFLFAFGAGDTIVNGLPTFAQSPRYKYQTIFAPALAGRPQMQAGGREPDLERLTAAAPDVVLTMDRETADILDRSGRSTVVLAWRQPEDVKPLMTLLGELFDRPEVADDYARYFDETVARISSRLRPDGPRPAVLYCNLARLTQEHFIGDWWITTAGGRSVTDNGRLTEAYTFTLEQLFVWDPEIIFLATPDDLAAIHADERFHRLRAVEARRVYVAPTGAHLWANRTIEQPLTILWAATLIHPELFADIDMVEEMQAFYSRFFGFAMTDAQAREILRAAL